MCLPVTWTSISCQKYSGSGGTVDVLLYRRNWQAKSTFTAIGSCSPEKLGLIRPSFDRAILVVPIQALIVWWYSWTESYLLPSIQPRCIDPAWCGAELQVRHTPVYALRRTGWFQISQDLCTTYGRTFVKSLRCIVSIHGFTYSGNFLSPMGLKGFWTGG